MKLRILASARRDLIEGFRFYHKHGEGVGAYFLDSLFSEIDSLILNAGAHPVFFERYHRLVARRFPFAVYYRVKDRTVQVYAVIDCRRNPAWIRKKLGGL